VGLTSTLSGIVISKTITPHIGFLHWLRRVEYFIPFFLGIEVIRREKSALWFFFNVIALIYLALFAYGLGQRYFQFPLIITQNEEYSKGIALRWVPGSHINSTFAGHYDLASFLVFTSPLIISGLFLLPGIKTKFFIISLLFMGLWLLVNSASRISFFSFIVSLCLTLIFLKKKKWIPLFLLLTFIFAIFSTNLVERYKRIFDFTIQKILQIESKNSSIVVNKVYALETSNQYNFSTPNLTQMLEDRSTNIRLKMEWPRAIRAFRKNPLLGTGYSSITLATDNDFLRALGETGFLGFTTFVIILVEVIYLIWKVGRLKLGRIEKVFANGLLAGVSGSVLNAFFIDIFEASKFAISFWLLVGLLTGLLRKNANR